MISATPARLAAAGTNYLRRVRDSLVTRVVFWFWGVRVGPKLRAFGIPRVRNYGVISFGAGVRMNSGWHNNPVGGVLGTTLWSFPGGSIIIEDGAGLSNATIAARCLVRIGSNTNIGGGCQIYDNDFHALPGRTEVGTEAVLIGRNCFIGADVIVLKGVSIGDGSIVGAGSVVSRSIPAREVWAGNPAKLLYRLEES